MRASARAIAQRTQTLPIRRQRRGLRERSEMSPDAVGADPEGVAVGVAEMELANAPRFVGRRQGHLKAELETKRVHRIDLLLLLEEPRHPDAAGCLVEGEGRCVCASRPLPAATEKDLRLSAASPCEARLTVALGPFEGRLPAERLEPSETVTYIGDVQYWFDRTYRHSAASLQLALALARVSVRERHPFPARPRGAKTRKKKESSNHE